MSRRGISVEDERRWVFNRLASDYRARPGYPDALVERLLALAGGAGARIAELGAGTGLLALALAGRGARVHAVEPAAAMLEVLRSSSPPPPALVTPVHASAEETTLPAGAFELVVLADALHWVDAGRAGREVGRLLAPGGVVAVVEPRLAATPFLDALSARIAQANPKARPGALPLAGFFEAAAGGAAGGSARHVTEPFAHEVLLEPDRLDAVLRSLSLVGPALGPAALQALLDDARALAAAHGGARWRRDLSLHWARLP